MKELELKHLAGYLPYGLKVLSGFGEYSELDSLYFSKDEHKRPSLNLMVSHFPKGFRAENFVDIKPILRPLSDLTKEIEVNGEKFVPIEVLLDIEAQINWSCSDYLVPEKGLNEWWVGLKEKPSYTFGYNKYKGFYMLNKFSESQIVNNQNKLWQKLFEWHFDIYGLIENNLAIDINTL